MKYTHKMKTQRGNVHEYYFNEKTGNVHGLDGEIFATGWVKLGLEGVGWVLAPIHRTMENK